MSAPKNFDYQEYLASRKWALKREAVRKRSNNRCERILKGRRCVWYQEAVHHLTYRNIGNEPLEDLMAVCNDCHKFLSGKTSFDFWQSIINKSERDQILEKERLKTRPKNLWDSLGDLVMPKKNEVK